MDALKSTNVTPKEAILFVLCSRNKVVISKMELECYSIRDVGRDVFFSLIFILELVIHRLSMGTEGMSIADSCYPHIKLTGGNLVENLPLHKDLQAHI